MTQKAGAEPMTDKRREEIAGIEERVAIAKQRMENNWANEYATDVPYLLSELERVERELAAIDAVLDRRPALADLKERYAKVERACSMAGRADKAERERDEALAGKEEALHLASDQIKAAKESGFDLVQIGVNEFEWRNVRAESAEAENARLREATLLEAARLVCGYCADPERWEAPIKGQYPEWWHHSVGSDRTRISHGIVRNKCSAWAIYARIEAEAALSGEKEGK
jgi:hypothetical protein